MCILHLYMAQPKKQLRFAVLATDVVLFAIQHKTLKVLLVNVHVPPWFNGIHGIPGGLVLPNETADDSVKRHMQGKAGIQPKEVYVEQLYTFSGIKRDPRGRVVSVGYLGLVPPHIASRAPAKNTYWQDVKKMPKLAYDHNDIVKAAIHRLKDKIMYTTLARYLLSAEFTLSDLQQAYEIILERTFDKRNFRKKMLSLDIMKELSRQRRGGAHRPPALYNFIGKNLHIFKLM